MHVYIGVISLRLSTKQKMEIHVEAGIIVVIINVCTITITVCFYCVLLLLLLLDPCGGGRTGSWGRRGFEAALKSHPVGAHDFDSTKVELRVSNQRTVAYFHFNMPFENSNLPGAGPILSDGTFDNWP